MGLFLPCASFWEKLSPAPHTKVTGWRAVREGILEEVLADVRSLEVEPVKEEDGGGVRHLPGRENRRVRERDSPFPMSCKILRWPPEGEAQLGTPASGPQLREIRLCLEGRELRRASSRGIRLGSPRKC